MNRITAIVIAAIATYSLPPAALGHSAAAPRAVVAAKLNGNGNCNAHYIRSSGSTLIEEGPCSGSLSGKLHATVRVGATLSGTFVFYTRFGQIKGHGSAKPHNGKDGIESFAGTLVVTGGTGRYTHAHGTAGLYGTFDRRNYAVVAQTRGTLYY